MKADNITPQQWFRMILAQYDSILGENLLRKVLFESLKCANIAIVCDNITLHSVECFD